MRACFLSLGLGAECARGEEGVLTNFNCVFFPVDMVRARLILVA